MRTATVALALALATAATAEEVEVDLELVLAVDMSGSMDGEERAVQRDGYVAAIADPAVWTAIAGGAHQRIALVYLEWAGAGSQQVVVDWRLVDTPEAARAFAAELAAQPLSRIRGTSISGGIDAARALFDGNGFEGWRRVIDVSGDGANRSGRPVTEARDAALAEGIEINGLPILIRPNVAEGDLARYYADCVIGGPGSFVLPARGTADLAEAIRRKLVQEIAGGPPPATPAAEGDPADCLIGERLRRLYEDR